VKRTDQRRAAIFALYQHDVTRRPLADVLPQNMKPFTGALAHAVDDHREELDAVIERHAEGWTLERIAPLERNILRVAILELRDPELVRGERPIPPEAAIDEAVETAKTYCGADAPAFVNGILAAALREVQENPQAR
jgi:transcription antitermination protein NusB